MTRINRILVPVDFTERCKGALRYAMFMAKRLDAQIEVLHVVWEPPPYVGLEVMVVSVPDMPERRRSLQELAEARAKKEIEAMVTELAGGEESQPSTVVLFGDTSRTIIKHAGETAVDLIVMATHARRGLSRALLGSVTDRVIRTAPCPVLAVPDTADTA